MASNNNSGTRSGRTKGKASAQVTSDADASPPIVSARVQSPSLVIDPLQNLSLDDALNVAPVSAAPPVAPVRTPAPFDAPSLSLVLPAAPTHPPAPSTAAPVPPLSLPPRDEPDPWTFVPSSPPLASTSSASRAPPGNIPAGPAPGSRKRTDLMRRMEENGDAPGPNPPSACSPEILVILGWAPNGAANEASLLSQLSTLPNVDPHIVELNFIEDSIKTEAVAAYVDKCCLPQGEISSKDGSIFIKYDDPADYEEAMRHEWPFGIHFQPDTDIWGPKASLFSLYHMFSTISPLDNDLIAGLRKAFWALGINAKYIRKTTYGSMIKIGFRNAVDFRKAGEYKDANGNWNVPYGEGKKAILNLVSSFFGPDMPNFFKLYVGGLTGAEDPQKVRERVGITLATNGFPEPAAVFFGAKPGVKFGFLLVEGKEVYNFLLDTKINTPEGRLSFATVRDFPERESGAKRRRY